MIKGKVKWFQSNLGYGFIFGPLQEEVFVHHSVITSNKRRNVLKKGQLVEFAFEVTKEGLKATQVRPIEAPK